MIPLEKLGHCSSKDYEKYTIKHNGENGLMPCHCSDDRSYYY